MMANRTDDIQQKIMTFDEFLREHRQKVSVRMNKVLWACILAGPFIFLAVFLGLFKNVSLWAGPIVSLSMAFIAYIHQHMLKRNVNVAITGITAIVALECLLLFMDNIHLAIHLSWFLTPILSLFFCDFKIYLATVGINYGFMLTAVWMTAPYYVERRVDFDTNLAYFLARSGNFTAETIAMVAAGYFLYKLSVDNYRELFDAQAKLYEKQEQLYKNEQHIKEQMDALTTLHHRISSIANIFMTVHELDMASDEVTQIKSQSAVVNDVLATVHCDPQGMLRSVMETVTDAGSYDDVMRFIDLSTLEQRMSKTDTISVEYLNKQKLWRRGRFVASMRDEQGHLTRVLWLSEDIDSEKRERDELIIASERAIAASEAKSNFLSNMSHEIRTPINAVLGMNEMIRRECDDNNILAYSESIKTAGNTLLGIVNDILDFSKIEAGKMEIIPVDYDLSSLVNDLVNMIQTRADDKGLKLILKISSEMPKFLHGDEVRIKQVVTNILTNAVKYTEKGSVTLSVNYEKTEEADSIMLKVSVTDTGIGIKPENMKKLFSEFDRIEEERNRKVEGTGLGMSITKHLLELMGSTLEVESVYEVGSTFSFRIRQTVVEWEAIGVYETSYKASLEKHAKYRETFHAPEAQILVVDDTEMNLTVFRSLLKQTGVKIDTAVSGDEGLALLYDKKYDMVFLDHMMPEKDGIETLRELRSRPKDPNLDTPVICLTANAISGAREKYLDAGFDDYLTKPIDCDKLEQMMIRYLPKQKVKRTLEEPVTESEGREKLPEFLLDISEINTENGITNSGSIPAYMETLKVFAKNAKTYAQEIEMFYVSDDLKNATIKIHALKSTARIIGAADLGELAQQLEDAGKAVDRMFLDAKLPELLNRSVKLGDELSVLNMESPDIDEGIQEISAEALEDAYSKIRKYAEDCNNAGIEEIMEMLAGYALSDDEREKVNAINEALEDFDFDGIVDLL